MTSKVLYAYKDSAWLPVDSTAYTYSKDKGSIDTGANYVACGYDTAMEFRIVNNKYQLYQRETVHHESYKNITAHIIQLYKDTGWTNSRVVALSINRDGDTIDFQHAFWDTVRSEWVIDDAIYSDYDRQRRCTYRLHYVRGTKAPYGSNTLDSMRYDEMGLLSEHLRYHSDSSHDSELTLRETYQYNAAHRLSCRIEYLPTDSLFIDSLTYSSLGHLLSENFSSRHPARHTHKVLGKVEYGYNNKAQIIEKRHFDWSFTTEEDDSPSIVDPPPVQELTLRSNDVTSYEMDQWGYLRSTTTQTQVDENGRYNWGYRDRTEFQRRRVLIDTAIHYRYNSKRKFDYREKYISPVDRWEPLDAWHYHYQEFISHGGK